MAHRGRRGTTFQEYFQDIVAVAIVAIGAIVAQDLFGQFIN